MLYWFSVELWIERTILVLFTKKLVVPRKVLVFDMLIYSQLAFLLTLQLWLHQCIQYGGVSVVYQV